MRTALLLLVLAMPVEQTRASALHVHVTVALCDNASQGIVPVPPAIGDGDNPRTNLYWGAMYGVKTWLKREKWQVTSAPSPNPAILERIVARKTIAGREVTITADAWRGRRIREAITSFLEQASNSSADVIAYIGHDGLMEFDVSPRVVRNGKRPRSIVLACISRRYFGPYLARAGSQPLLMTNGLMAPEAYTLTAAIEAYARNGDVVAAAAKAYHAHQKCGLRAAKKLFQAK